MGNSSEMYVHRMIYFFCECHTAKGCQFLFLYITTKAIYRMRIYWPILRVKLPKTSNDGLTEIEIEAIRDLNGFCLYTPQMNRCRFILIQKSKEFFFYLVTSAYIRTV